MWVLKLHDYFKHTLPLADFPQSVFQCPMFLLFDFSVSVFPTSCFLMRYLLLLDFSQTKVRRFPSHRMEPAGRIIFQCPIGNAIIGSPNVLTLTLLMPDCCGSMTFYQKCWHVIFYVKGIDALFLSPDFFKHRLLSRSTCWCPSFRCRINRKTYV